MKKKKLPFNKDSVLYQIYDQVPDPAGKNHFRAWFEWVTDLLLNGVGDSENVIFIDGTEPAEVLVPYTGDNTTLLFTGDNGRPNGIYRVRWYDKLQIGEVVKLTVIVAQSLVDASNNEFPINIEADTLNAREYAEPASYSDPSATTKELSVYLKRPTTVFYITKRVSPQSGLAEVVVFGSHESEAVVSDTPPGGGGGGGGVPQ